MLRILELFVVVAVILGMPCHAAPPHCIGFYVPGTYEDGNARSISVSPDGGWVAIADDSRRVVVHDTQFGRIVASLAANGQRIRTVAFCPRGLKIVAGLDDGQVFVWETESWRLSSTWTSHEGPVNTIAFAADGGVAATGGDDQTVLLHDAQSGDLLHKLIGHTGVICGTALNRDGSQLLSAGEDAVRIWDVKSAKQLGTLSGNEEQAHATSVAVSPDGRFAAAGFAKAGGGCIWELGSRKLVAQLNGHDGALNAICFTSDGKNVMSAAQDGNVRLCDATTGRTEQVRQGHTGAVLSLSQSIDGSQIASCGKSGEVIIWRSDRPGGFLRSHSGDVKDLSFSQNGNGIRAFVKSLDGRKTLLRMWPLDNSTLTDLAPEKLPEQLMTATHRVTSANGRMHAFAEAQSISISHLQKIGTWETDHLFTSPNYIAAIALSPDEKSLWAIDNCSSSQNAGLYQLDVRTGRLRSSIRIGDFAQHLGVRHFMANSAGTLAVVAYESGTLEGFDLLKSKSLWRRNLQVIVPGNINPMQSMEIYQLSYLGDRHMAVAADDTLHLLDAVSGEKLASTIWEKFRTIHCVVATGNDRVVTGGREYPGNPGSSKEAFVLREWHVDISGRKLQPLASTPVADDEIRMFSEIRHGQRVAVLETDGSVRLWSLSETAMETGGTSPANVLKTHP